MSSIIKYDNECIFLAVLQPAYSGDFVYNRDIFEKQCMGSGRVNNAIDSTPKALVKM
jgi:hypothetical protein